MKKEADDFELREEYDFSAGVRGKYADRVQEGVRLPGVDRHGPDELDYRVWHSRAIGGIQAVEHALALFLLVSSGADAATARRTAWEVVVNPREAWRAFERAFGPLFPDSTLPERLRRLFVERAWWVHHVSPGVSETSEAGAVSLEELEDLEDLESFCERSRAAYSELLDITRKRLKERGAPADRLDELMKKVWEADRALLKESA